MSKLHYFNFLSNHSPKVIVLCHTLQWDESIAAIKLAADLSPSSRLLVLFDDVPEYMPRPPINMLYSQTGPQMFTDTVMTML